MNCTECGQPISSEQNTYCDGQQARHALPQDCQRQAQGCDCREALRKLTVELGDHVIDAYRLEWGNTNAAVLKHWRDEGRAAVARCKAQAEEPQVEEQPA